VQKCSFPSIQFSSRFFSRKYTSSLVSVIFDELIEGVWCTYFSFGNYDHVVPSRTAHSCTVGLVDSRILFSINLERNLSTPLILNCYKENFVHFSKCVIDFPL